MIGAAIVMLAMFLTGKRTEERGWRQALDRIEHPVSNNVSDQILEQYRALRAMPSGRNHTFAHRVLQFKIIDNQDALFELIFSGKVTDYWDLHRLIGFGGSHGSVAKAHNLGWIPFLTRVRDHLDELPACADWKGIPASMLFQKDFDWLDRVHHYWDDNYKEAP